MPAPEISVCLWWQVGSLHRQVVLPLSRGIEVLGKVTTEKEKPELKGKQVLFSISMQRIYLFNYDFIPCRRWLSLLSF